MTMMHVLNPLIRDAEPINTDRPYRYRPIDWSLVTTTHVEAPRTAQAWIDMVVAFANLRAPGCNVTEFYEASKHLPFSAKEKAWISDQLEFLFVWLDDQSKPLWQLPPQAPRLTRTNGGWYWERKAAGSDLTEFAVAEEALFPERAVWHQLVPTAERRSAAVLQLVSSREDECDGDLS